MTFSGEKALKRHEDVLKPRELKPGQKIENMKIDESGKPTIPIVQSTTSKTTSMEEADAQAFEQLLDNPTSSQKTSSDKVEAGNSDKKEKSNNFPKVNN